jgi:hypothetical protein
MANAYEPRLLTSHEQRILESFDYHRPSREQAMRIESNRLAFKQCAFVVLRNCPAGADTTAALRQLHESMMTANKAIACEPGTPHEAPPSEIALPPSPMDDDDRVP